MTSLSKLIEAADIAATITGDAAVEISAITSDSRQVSEGALFIAVEAGILLGAALMLVFNEDLLPPPEGLGTTARSLATVPGGSSDGGLLVGEPDGSGNVVVEAHHGVWRVSIAAREADARSVAAAARRHALA